MVNGFSAPQLCVLTFPPELSLYRGLVMLPAATRVSPERAKDMALATLPSGARQPRGPSETQQNYGSFKTKQEAVNHGLPRISGPKRPNAQVLSKARQPAACGIGLRQ